MKKKKKKIKKKREKKHKKMTKTLNTAVKMRNLVLREEVTWAGNYASNALKYLDKLSKIAKNKLYKAYSKLYERDLKKDIIDAVCAGDEYYENLETMV